MFDLLTEISIYGFGDFIFKLMGYASFLIYARLFNPKEFGILSLVGTIGAIINIFLELGLNNGTQRFYLDPNVPESRRPHLVSTGLTILITWSSFLTAVALFLSYHFKGLFATRYGIVWTFIALILLSNIPFQLLLYSQNMLRIYFSPWRYAFLSFYKNLVSFFFSLLLILVFKIGLLGFFLGEFIALTVSIPISFLFIRKDLILVFDRSIARELIDFGYPFIFAGMGFWLFSCTDRWLLSELSSIAEVGIYSIATRFAMILFFVNEIFGRAWSPYALKLYSQDVNYRMIYGRIFSYWFFVMTLIGALISIFSSEILQLSTPETYWRSAAPLSVLTIGVVFSSTTQVTALGISLERRTHLFSIGSWGTALINFSLNLLLIPRFGALGAALGTLVSYFILSSYYLYWTQKLHPFSLEFRKLGLCVLINLATIIFTLNINQAEWSTGRFVSKIVFLFLIITFGKMIGILKVEDFVKFFDEIRRQRR
jgi:O-antigen/teichoic acid export membrane protein